MGVGARNDTDIRRGRERGERIRSTSSNAPRAVALHGAARSTATGEAASGGRDPHGGCDTMEQREALSDRSARAICCAPKHRMGNGIFPAEHIVAPAGDICPCFAQTIARGNESDSRREAESAIHANNNWPLRSRPDKSRADLAVPGYTECRQAVLLRKRGVSERSRIGAALARASDYGADPGARGGRVSGVKAS